MSVAVYTVIALLLAWPLLRPLVRRRTRRDPPAE
jgi:hypothetical protein